MARAPRGLQPRAHRAAVVCVSLTRLFIDARRASTDVRGVQRDPAVPAATSAADIVRPDIHLDLRHPTSTPLPVFVVGREQWTRIYVPFSLRQKGHYECVDIRIDDEVGK